MVASQYLFYPGEKNEWSVKYKQEYQIKSEMEIPCFDSFYQQ